MVLPLFSTGTISLTNGSAEVVGASTFWLVTDIRPGDVLRVDGHGILYFIESWTDLTHITLDTPYTGATGSGLGYSILRMSGDWGSNRVLSLQVADYVRSFTVDTLTSEELIDALEAVTAQVTIATAEKTAAAASATAAAGSATAANTSKLAAQLAETNAETAETNAETAASTATTQAGISTTQAGISTTQAGLASADRVLAQAAAAASGGYRYLWSTDTTATDPGTGKVKMNAGNTALYISETDANSAAMAAAIATWDDSTNTALRATIKITKIGAPGVFKVLSLTAAIVDGGTWNTLTVAQVVSNGVLANNDPVTIEVDRTGNLGNTGATGAPGGVTTFNARNGVVVPAQDDYTADQISVTGTTNKFLTDGDKGDVTVSASGATFTIDNGVVSNTKLANMVTATIKGRNSAGAGAPEDISMAQLKALLAYVAGDITSGTFADARMPLRLLGTPSGPTVNLDTIAAAGFYTYFSGTTTTGMPPVATAGMLLHQVFDVNAQTQLAFDYNSDEVWRRRKESGVWGAWRNLTGQLPTREVTGASTLILGDQGGAIRSTGAATAVITIPTNASVPIPIDATFTFERWGTGELSIAPAAGVTLNSVSNRRKVATQYSVASLHKKSADEWLLFGDLAL